MTPKKRSGKKTRQKFLKRKSKVASKKRSVARKKAGTSSKPRAAKRAIRRGATPRRSAGTPSAQVVLRAPSPDDVGLSNTASADSESVEELLDEGNTFEAGIVSGVERADDSEGKEVRTREVPEDDVPEEYLDNET
ncbi:MAG TPA: hypothetical protein VMG82_10140 [Candidatus Sulfotelmatobacter sp.]|nr:hypothetical protein [Candidatus Sulfotelmatobacter sp.]